VFNRERLGGGDLCQNQKYCHPELAALSPDVIGNSGSVNPATNVPTRLNVSPCFTPLRNVTVILNQVQNDSSSSFLLAMTGVRSIGRGCGEIPLLWYRYDLGIESSKTQTSSKMSVFCYSVTTLLFSYN